MNSIGEITISFFVGLFIGMVLIAHVVKGWEEVHKPNNQPMWISVDDKVFNLVERKP